MVFNQRDKRWAGVKLGSAGLISMGGFGCTTCCLAEINNYFGANCTPDQVAAKKTWYTRDGLVLWPKLNLKNAIWLRRGYRFDKDIIKEYINNTDLGVIIEVPLGAGRHWLTGKSVNWMGRIMAKDPLYGDVCDILKRYKSITGYSTFKRRTPPLA